MLEYAGPGRDGRGDVSVMAMLRQQCASHSGGSSISLGFERVKGRAELDAAKREGLVSRVRNSDFRSAVAICR